ncbi:MAG: endopeptidase La [Clostridia bacterium]|nr:endopeptidase La [Clostridia bacterium]
MSKEYFKIYLEYNEPIFEEQIVNVPILDKLRLANFNDLSKNGELFVCGIFEYEKEYYGTICRLLRVKQREGEAFLNVKGVERVKIISFAQSNDIFELSTALVESMTPSFYSVTDSSAFATSIENCNKYIEELRKSAPIEFSDVGMIQELYFDDWIKRNSRILKYVSRELLFAEKKDEIRASKLQEGLMMMAVSVELDKDIEKTLSDSMSKDQNDYILREKLRIINKELYNTDGDSEKYREKIDKLNAPDDVKQVLIDELAKVTGMQVGSPESYVARNYIDTVCSLPWGVYTEENLTLENARKILEEDHFGIEEVKERIMEFLAIHKLVKEKKGNILCFYGPPGTGKTSVVKSIAKALGRKYVRLSLGGVHDEAEIRGHRRTYIGALAGKIITGIRDAGSMNPVFLMDEVDKLSADAKGDPASALLEVLDPEQNKAFRDNFIDLPFDLSQVLFITTANNIQTIARPLLDRMELIEMSSYTIEEKKEIALRHLIPKQLKEHAVPDNTVTFTPEAVEEIIDAYTLEAGVRKLEQLVARIIRKIAVKYGDVGYQPVTVDKDSLVGYLGAPKHTDKEIAPPEVGVITGLAYTEYGGVTMEMECVLTAGKGNLQLTGNLGDVMKESAKEAFTLVRSKAEKYGIPQEAFEKDVHINATEGGVPKDGPSAGVALSTVILSAFTGKKIRSDIALTGEITITGKVLAIGGVKEKSLGALRKGITTIILPSANKADVEALSPTIKDKINYIFVDRIEQVFDKMLID